MGKMRAGLQLWAIGFTLLVASWVPEAATGAVTLYTNEADFLSAAANLPILLNDFTDYPYQEWLVHPVQASSNGISYYISSSPPIHLVGYPGRVSTVLTSDQIVVTFTCGNVTGVGGQFYSADTNGILNSGSVTVTLNDGTTTNIESSSGVPASFLGFLSDGPIMTSLLLTNSSGAGYPALAHFYVVDGIPAPALSLTGTNTLLISWYAAPTGFVLQASAQGLSGAWTNVAQTPQPAGAWLQVIVPVEGQQRFFRLKK